MRAGRVGFDMWYSVDLKSVIPRIEDIIERTVRATAENATVDAKKLAPVRRVVKGDRSGKVRKLSVQERSAEQSVRQRLGLRSGRVIYTAAERRMTSMPSNPYLRGPGRRPPRSDPPELAAAGRGVFANKSGKDLNRHGRAELDRGISIKGPTIYGKGADQEVRKNRLALRRSNSAIYFQRTKASDIAEGLRGGGRYTLGGRLRGEIYSEPADIAAGIIKWWVISPTYYARYVEFGTRHNRAQPYMRPALTKARRVLGDTLRSNLNKLNWKPKRKHTRTRF
jgi:HK97 gp10 family phage protein